jgi:hypothetical protein
MAFGLGVVKRSYGLAFQRRMKNADAVFPNRFFGTSHAGRINQSAMKKFIRRPFTSGFTEIGLHPGADVDDSPIDDAWRDPLARLRPAECDWLCNPGLAELLQSQEVRLGRLSAIGALT